MRESILALIISLCLLGCSPELPEVREEEPEAYNYNELGITELDSTLLVTVNLPEITNFAHFDSATISIFQTLADKTQGKMYVAANSYKVVNTVIEIIDNHGGDDIDLCFLIDKTGSMTDDIYMMQASMKLIFDAIKKYQNINVAIVYYGDKNVDGRKWIELHDFTQDFDKLEKNFMKVSYSGGGDAPESVYDGAYKAIDELSWSSIEKRVMLVLGDAPSLVPPLSTYTIDDIIAQSKMNDIESNYYPVVVGFAGMEIGPANENLITNIYPNPANSIVNILIGKKEPLTLELFDVNGTLIISEEVSTTKHQINVSTYKEGLYVIRLSSLNGSMVDSQKIIIQR